MLQWLQHLLKQPANDQEIRQKNLVSVFGTFPAEIPVAGFFKVSQLIPAPLTMLTTQVGAEFRRKKPPGQQKELVSSRLHRSFWDMTRSLAATLQSFERLRGYVALPFALLGKGGVVLRYLAWPPLVTG